MTDTQVLYLKAVGSVALAFGAKGTFSKQVNKGSVPWPTNWAWESPGESILFASVTVL